jgi:hypothetical protein
MKMFIFNKLLGLLQGFFLIPALASDFKYNYCLVVVSSPIERVE